MKKAGIFAAVIAVVLLFAQFYNYRLLGYTQDAMYVIDGARAAQILKNGGKGEESLDLNLKKYETSAPLYSRGGKYFVGEEYDALNVSYPVYMNEGSFLYSFSDEMDLITSDFSTLNTYDGLYVADGHSYNQDREQADPDELIFMKNPGGLFLNVQDMIIRSAVQEKTIPVNSLMELKPEGVAWYSFEDGSYRYGQYQDVIQAEVTVGSVTMPYGELVARLKGLEEDGEPEAEGSRAAEEMEAAAEPEMMAEVPLEEPGSQEASQGSAGSPSSGWIAEQRETEEEWTVRPAEEASADRQQEPEEEASASAPAALETEESLPLHPPVPGDKDGWRFPDGTEEEDENSGGGDGTDGDTQETTGAPETPGTPETPGEGGEGEQGGQEGGGTQGGEGEQTGPEGPDGGGEEFPFEKPQVSVEDFSFSVYSARARLSIQDPSLSIVKGVRLVFYKKGEARASYRKMFYTPGEITMEPLKPDTTYEVEGYFDYIHPQYGKQREVFLERTVCGKTLPVSALKPIKLHVEADGTAIEPNSIQLREFQLMDLTAARASSSNAEGQISAVPYISSVQMEFEKKGTPGWNAPSTSLGSTLVNQLKQGKAILWKTSDILDSDSQYRYRITFYDRYGNELPLEEQLSAEGNARTCKQIPAAILTADHKSTIDRVKLNVQVQNPDKARYSETPYLYVTYADMPGTAIPFRLEGGDKELSRLELDRRAETDLVFTSLLPNTVYTVWVKGSFDVEDGRVHDQEIMGQLPVTTGSLTGLGTVSFYLEADDIACDAAEITSRIRSEIPQALYPFISRLEFSLKDKDSGAQVFSAAFDKETLEKETLEPGKTYTLRSPSGTEDAPSYDPEITVQLPSGSGTEKSVWNTLLTNGILKVDFGEGTLASATDFLAHMRAKAVRGSSDGTAVEEDVTGRYYQAAFKTLKQPARVDHEMSYVNSSSATFYELRVLDPDEAVLGGRLILRLRNDSNQALIEVRTTTVEELNKMESITFQNLDKDTGYRVEVVASEYNEGYSASSKVLQKLLGEFRFRSVNRLFGTMKLDSMENGYEAQNAEDGFGVGSINLFDVNRGELNYAINSNGLYHSANYLVSDYIPVEEGSVYMLGGGTYAAILQYDEDKNLIGAASATGTATGNYYRAKEGVRHIRAYTHINASASAYVSEVLFTEPDCEANLIRRTEITEGLCVSGNTETKKADAAVTGFIPVTPGEVLLRKDSTKATAASWQYRRVSFYDAEKNSLSTPDPDGTFSMVTVPQNARYMRVNMHKDYKDQIYMGHRSEKMYGKNLLDQEENPSLTWVPGMYVNERNRYVKQTYNYLQYCEYIPVDPSAIYYMSSVGGLQVFDAEKSFMGYFGSVSYIKMPDKAAYVRANVNFGENYTVKPVLRQVTPVLNLDSVNIGLRVTMSDQEGNLGDSPAFTLEITKTDAAGNTEHWTESYDVDPEERSFDQIIYLEDSEPDSQYEISQTVVLGGHRVVLASVSLGTASTARVIKSEAGLRAARYSPMDDFIVVEDLDVTTASEVIGNFYGTMDFQGHIVTMEGRRTLFVNLMEGAQVRNLAADIKVTGETGSINERGLLVTTNRGLLENLVLKTSLDNGLDNAGWGGICMTNYGVIDNFAIQMTGDIYTRGSSGLAARTNYGQISNGYLVSSGQSRITMDLDVSPLTGHSLRAGLVASHAGGTISNVYAAAELEDPAQKDFGNQGLVAAESFSPVRNAFSVGMVMQGGVPSAATGPAVGYTSSVDLVKNVSYVETKTFSDSHYANTYNNQVTTMSLWDQEWMESAVNEDGRFRTDMVSDGLYPQLQMPACMDGRQPMVQLPSRDSKSIKLLSHRVMEQTEDHAMVRFYFENRNRLEVKGLELAIMDLKTGVRTYVSPAAQTEIQAQGVDEEGLYYADVKVSHPQYFRSRYYVNKFTAGLSGNDNTNFDVEETSQEKMEVDIEFYQEILTVADWRDKVASSQVDVYGNYRLKAEVLDFGNLKPADFKTQYRLNRVFYGKIDGQWKDENGELHTTVLKNIVMDMPYFIHDLYGSVSNLKVENLQINGSETNKEGYLGFIRRVVGGTVDHVEIVSSEIHFCHRGGLLTSETQSGAVIQNSSVRDSRIVTFEPSSNWKAYAGGLSGYSNRTEVKNCFVQGLEIENMEALDNAGVGGLLGSTDTVDLKNCYSEGTIHTGYRNVGGLIGYQGSYSATIENCYSKVSIDAYGSFVGGLIGALASQNSYDTLKGCLSLGNLFVHSTDAEGVHRLIGYPSGGKHGQNFGYSSQMFNNQVDPGDPDDAEAVFTAEELKLRDTYLKRLGWDSGAFALKWEEDGQDQGVADGYLPKLCATDGSLLPGQAPIPFGTGEMTLEVDGFALNGSAGNECYEWFGHRDITQAYKMIFSLSYDGSRYQVAETDGVPQIYMDGMNLNTQVRTQEGTMKNGYKEAWMAGQNRQRWEFPFVESELGGNIYCLNVVMQSREDPDIQVTLSAPVSPQGGTAIRIGSAKEWNENMMKYKDTYGNFELTADIDLSSIPADELVTGIKLNSLTSSGGPWTISGIRHDVKGVRDSFISNCLSGISNVNFKDCSWTVPEADLGKTYENIGLIGMNQGAIRNVSFERITVRSGLGSYTGCIGYNTGTVEDVTLKEITVSGDAYVGGLAGGTMQPMRRITAEGTLKKDGDSWTSDYLVSGRQSIGGILGRGSLTEKVMASGIKVLGTNGNKNTSKNITYIGGAIGEGSFAVPGQSIGENKKLESLVADCVVTAEDTTADARGVIKYLGGASGSGSSNYVAVENVDVRCPSASYVGGIAGNGYITYGRAATVSGTPAYQIPETVVEGLEYAGGAVGSGGMSSGIVEAVKVKALKKNAGGISGVNVNGISSCLVDRVQVWAPQASGGLAGESRVSANSNLVARSDIETIGAYAGGTIGLSTTSVVEHAGNGVIHTKIQAGRNEETGESFAGGLVGSFGLAGNVYGNYTRETTVTADGDNVGGLFGYTAGGWIQRNFSDSSTVVTGRNHVGGFTGLMQGRQTEISSTYEDALFYESYNANTVRGQDYVGGFVGCYLPGSGDHWIPSAENFYGLVMMGTVEAGGASSRTATSSDAGKAAGDPAASRADLFLNMGNTMGWSGKSLRLFTEASLNGEKAPDLYPDMEYLGSYKTKSLGNSLVADEDADVKKLTSTLLVTSGDLMDTRIYNQKFEVGGMNWAGSWNYQGLGRMDTETETDSKFKPGVGVRVRRPDGTILEIPKETPLYDATGLIKADGKLPSILLPEGAVSCNWYRTYQANTSQYVHIKSNVDEFPLAGRGYYIGIATMADKTTKWTSIVKMDTEAYMPFANVGSIWSRGAQEGFPQGFGTDLTATDSLWGWKEATETSSAGYTYAGYSGTDNEFYGGVVIPQTTETVSLLDLKEGETGNVLVYPSGADRINVELGADRKGMTRLTVESDGKVLCDTVPSARVYTVDYDYRSPVTVTLTAGTFAQTVTVDASSLRRTVMVWGSSYYYTRGGALMDENGVVLDEEIIHLWDGEALAMDGTVYDLETGGSREQSAEPWNEAREPEAFWTDGELRAYGAFTEVPGEEGTMVREQQLVKKSGELYALTGGQSLKGMVLDSYNGETYASFLNEDGTMKDAADGLHTPEHFNRKGIAHMSSTLNAEAPYVLVRYANGAASGFNYVTGEELSVENAFSDVSFLDFAAGFAGQFFGSSEGSLEFADLKELENQLVLAPITDEQVSDAISRLEKTEEAENADPDSRPGDGIGEGGGTASGQKTGEDLEAPILDPAGTEPSGASETSQEGSVSDPSGEAETGAEGMETGTENTEQRSEGGEQTETEGTEIRPENGDPAEPEGESAGEEGMAETDGTADAEAEGVALEEPAEEPEKDAETENDSQKAGMAEEDGSSGDPGIHADTGKEDGGNSGSPDPQSGQPVSEEDPGHTADERKESAEDVQDGSHEPGDSKGQEEKTPARLSGRTAAYTYAFNTRDGSSRLYRTEDLLSDMGEEPMDEEEKLELMKAAGIVNEELITVPSASEERSRTGILIFASTAAAAVGLAWFLIRRKRRYEE